MMYANKLQVQTSKMIELCDFSAISAIWHHRASVSEVEGTVESWYRAYAAAVFAIRVRMNIG